jgi:hypothetical protein
MIIQNKKQFYVRPVTDIICRIDNVLLSFVIILCVLKIPFTDPVRFL